MIHVVIIGNIGAGKSTLLALLRKAFAKSKDAVLFCDEPVSEWQACGPDKRNALQEFYADKPKNATAFQTIVFSTRIRNYYRALDAFGPQPPAIVISERSIHTDRIFAHATIPEGSLERLAYDEIHAAVDAISDKHREHLIVYLRTPPEVCYDRTHNVRKRTEETSGGGVPLEYLQLLHNAHDEYFNTVKCSKVEYDNSKDKIDIEALVGKIRAKVVGDAKKRAK
jgi:deoxyadenosine/deoxycytidine kinase